MYFSNNIGKQLPLTFVLYICHPWNTVTCLLCVYKDFLHKSLSITLPGSSWCLVTFHCAEHTFNYEENDYDVIGQACMATAWEGALPRSKREVKTRRPSCTVHGALVTRLPLIPPSWDEQCSLAKHKSVIKNTN